MGNPIFCLGSVRIGINICEDIWFPDGPAQTQVKHGGSTTGATTKERLFMVERMKRRAELYGHARRTGHRTRVERKAAGNRYTPAATFVPEKPCKRGHYLRYEVNRQCVLCVKEAGRRRRDRRRKAKKSTKEVS